MSNLTIKDIDGEIHLDKDALSDISGARGRNPQTGESIKIKATNVKRKKISNYRRLLKFFRII